MTILWQGTGLAPLGWRHRPDGTATATAWLRVFWFPVLPVRRDVYTLGASVAERVPGWRGRLASLCALSWREVPVQRWQRTAFSLREALATLASTYVVLPLAMLSPFVALFLATAAMQAGWLPAIHVHDEHVPYFLCVHMFVFFAALLVAVRKARTLPPRVPDRLVTTAGEGNGLVGSRFRRFEERRAEPGRAVLERPARRQDDDDRRPGLDERYPVGRRA